MKPSKTKTLFRAGAALEVLTGVALLAVPELVVDLLLGEGMGPIGIRVTRVLGIALLSLGLAAWEPAHSEAQHAPRVGLCTYNLGIAIFLVLIALSADNFGVLLWPVAVVHLATGIAMSFLILKSGR